MPEGNEVQPGEQATILRQTWLDGNHWPGDGGGQGGPQNS